MRGTEIAAVLGTVSTIVGGLYATYRLAKQDKYKASADNAAVLLAGWKDLQESIAREVERVKKSCQEEIANLKKEHDEDRREWAEEKAAMQKEIETLKEQVFTLMRQVNRPPHTRQRKSDIPEQKEGK